jgi:type IV secretory pathway TrbD component
MIQRIQTVFLFLAIIALAAFNILPYWQTSVGEDGISHGLMSYGFATINSEETSVEYGLYASVAGVSALAIIILLIEIINFKNRILQLKLAIGNSLLMSLNLLLMTYFIMNLQEEYQGGFGVGIFIYALAMILNILARRFIQKDENLVRSVDRLR